MPVPTKPSSTPAPATTKPTPASTPSTMPKPGGHLAAFAAQVTAHRAAQPPRLVFAMDATGSRQHAWDLAVKVQSEMFTAAAGAGLLVQLVAFMGGLQLYGGGTVVGMVDGTPTVAGGEKVDDNPARLLIGPQTGPKTDRKPTFTSSSDVLGALMRKVTCRVGHTQIERVLRHAVDTHRATPIKAMVIVGDMFEEEKRTEEVMALARQLGHAGVPVFMFQEGNDPDAKTAFEAIAKASGGAYALLSDGSADQLRDLLKAVAVFATSGVDGLKTMIGTDKRAAGALPTAAAVLLTCLTEGRSGTVPPKPKLTPAEERANVENDPEIDTSIPVKGPRPKSPTMLAAEAVMPILDAIDLVEATDTGTHLLGRAEVNMNKAMAIVNKAMTTDFGTGLAAAEAEGAAKELSTKAQVLARKMCQQPPPTAFCPGANMAHARSPRCCTRGWESNHDRQAKRSWMDQAPARGAG